MLGFLAYSLLALRSQDRHTGDDATMAINGDDVIARLERVENKVDALDQKVDTIDKKVDALDRRVDTIDKKVDALDKRVGVVEMKVDAVDKKVDELGNATKIRFEKIGEDLKKLGEGYEQGLKQIARQIKNLDAKWSEKWTPHDMALKDHGKRITALEQRQK
jgi:chromosome segregation ATPase